MYIFVGYLMMEKPIPKILDIWVIHERTTMLCDYAKSNEAADGATNESEQISRIYDRNG